ncbi:hypothetical protein, partial [Bacillus thuringiensis]|uniref:hypothetical protein n=1 Tax=Bacillus thuringiensis TaxID=1428 RepID=UPI001C92F55B
SPSAAWLTKGLANKKLARVKTATNFFIMGLHQFFVNFRKIIITPFHRWKRYIFITKYEKNEN